MSMQDYEAAKEIMTNYPDKMEFVGPRSESLIESAEKTLGLKFLEIFRRFLSEFGTGSFGSVEIYGVITADFVNPGVPDAIWYTLTERKEGGFPQNYVPLADVGDGDLYCLDIDKQGNREAPIIVFTPGWPVDEQPYEVVAEDFGAFLLDRVQQEVEFMKMDNKR